MARRKKRRHARRHRRNPLMLNKRRRSRRRRNPLMLNKRRRSRRRNPLMLNKRRRHRRNPLMLNKRRRGHRRNPGGGSVIKSFMSEIKHNLVGGALVAAVDTFLADKGLELIPLDAATKAQFSGPIKVVAYTALGVVMKKYGPSFLRQSADAFVAGGIAIGMKEAIHAFMPHTVASVKAGLSGYQGYGQLAGGGYGQLAAQQAGFGLVDVMTYEGSHEYGME